MKILMVNGSPRKGETRAVLEEMGKVFAELGAAYEIVDLGGAPLNDCIACGRCSRTCPQHLDIPRLLKEASAVLDA